MLDTDTKRRIDTARDILVGKVPDPKSQVEQITIALIYKFMDDMDAEAVELGGKRKFFTGKYAGYRWSKLMELGGNDKYTSYSEGIAKMTQNEALPELFRNIFKNAYLPYRDPETLNAFLKTINEFSYDHSERLGDAFEYLLSVLGSQGDAGQFRTPRHIIDFMVEILAPKKTETVLDPACGTAGFLISAYKHILRTNTDAKGRSTLTPDDKGRLAKNFKGYDISPDMVRLSLVNLYLHGFTDPHIYEYDSLTSEERWNEYADVILANPPFMSPKGGIKPHKRFSIQAKRSEVLFVDYMAEHLNPHGRAAIIVPEGIIFQSQTAYTDLRKMLVENSLVAVISLPAGCFNPYSGVKTSILILDRSLAKSAKSIAFFKVENDGLGLGAQRRVIEKNDLPHVQAELTAYLDVLRIGGCTEAVLSLASTAQIVPKEKIASNGDYNLSAERYREGTGKATAFPLIALAEVCERVQYGLSVPLNTEQAGFKTFRMNELVNGRCVDRGDMKCAEISQTEFEKYRLSRGDLLFNRTNSFEHVGRTGIFELDGDYCFASYLIRLSIVRSKADPSFINALMNSENFQVGIKQFASRAIGQSNINARALQDYLIPLPPLEVQREIVEEVQAYQEVINGARAVLDHYRPHIAIHPGWPMVAINDVSIRITKGSSPTWQGIKYTSLSTDVLFVTSENVGLGELLLDNPKYVERRFNEIEPKSVLKRGDVLTNIVGASIGRTAIFDLDTVANVNQAVCVIRPKSELVMSKYLMTLLNSPDFIQKLLGNSVENARANISMGVLGSLTIPLPPLSTQQAIVAEIEAEQALVGANRELITRFEHKIQVTLARLWGEESA